MWQGRESKGREGWGKADKQILKKNKFRYAIHSRVIIDNDNVLYILKKLEKRISNFSP